MSNHFAELPEEDWDQGRVSTLRDFIIVIRERWILALCFALIFSVGYAFWKLKEKPLYLSTAVLKIDVTRDSYMNMQEGFDQTRYVLDVDNHLRKLQSRELMMKVLASLTPAEKERLLRPYKLEDEEVPSVESIIAGSRSFSAKAENLILMVSAVNRDPDMSMLLANRFTEKYLEIVDEKARSENRKAIEFLTAQTEDLERNVEEAEMAVHEYRQAHNLLSIEDNQNIIVARIQSLTTSLTDINLDCITVETQMAQVEEAGKDTAALMKVPAIAQAEEVNTVYNKLKGLEAERELLFEEYLERHPVMIDNENRIKSAVKQLDNVINRKIVGLKKQHEELLARKGKFQAELLAAEQDGLRLDKMGVQYNILLRELSSAKATYDQILRSLNETKVSSQLEDLKIDIVDTAVKGGKVRPIPDQIIKNSVYIFLGVFVLLPIVIEFFDNKLKTQWDIERYLKQGLLGEFPSIRRFKKDKLPRIILDGLDESIEENFRGLYTHIEVKSKVPSPKAMLITSTEQSEGKSFVCSNLAAMLARHEYRVLIMDCDFRRPRQHSDFGMDNSAGILRWFENGGDLNPEEDLLANKDLGITAVKEPLYLLRAGGTSRASTEVLQDDNFRYLVDMCKHYFDVVLIDTPPAGLFPDSLILGRYANEAIYVCRHNAIRRQKAKYFVDQLVESGVEVLGIVWNAMKSSSLSGRGYGYGYGHYNYKSREKYYKKR